MKMIFKKDKETNEIIAFMPYDFTNWQGDFTCYTHNGQHGYSDYRYYLSCKKASYKEYLPLLNELKSIGYNIQVIDRINGKVFKQAYQDFMERWTVNNKRGA